MSVLGMNSLGGSLPPTTWGLHPEYTLPSLSACSGSATRVQSEPPAFGQPAHLLDSYLLVSPGCGGLNVTESLVSVCHLLVHLAGGVAGGGPDCILTGSVMGRG